MGSDPDKLLYPKKENQHTSEKNEKVFVRHHSDPVGSCGSRVPRALLFSTVGERK